jgi:pantetheine-phosphate adenylyltransferase
MLKESTRQLGNVSVATFEGLMVDFARQSGATAVLRGIRAITDYEYEFQMALMNRRLAPEIETVFLQPAADIPSSVRGWSKKLSASAAKSMAWCLPT